MNKLLVFIIFLAMTFMSCSNEDCRTCTGTVTNTGDNADWTVCQDDGVLTQTNNITGESTETSNTLPQSVAFFISIGLECSE